MTVDNGSFEVSDVVAQVERRLHDVAAAKTPTEQALVACEAVMWLWMLGDFFGARTALKGLDRQRLSGLYHARHKGLHDAIRVVELSDTYSDYYTEMYGAPTWAKLPPARHGGTVRNQDDEADYRQVLEGHLVLDTLGPLVAALRVALL